MKQEQSPSMQKARSAIKNRWCVARGSKGFSLVEVILASAVFILLVTALVGAYLYGQEATSLAGNRSRANMLAEEGLEAVRNIRDATFTDLTDGTFGLTTTGNQWDLSGVSDISDIFTRAVTIATVDPKRKAVTANVTWTQNAQRTGTVSLVTRLTNWIVASVSHGTGGLLIYGDGTTTPKYRTYDTTANTFGAQTATLPASSGTTFIMRTSPTQTEGIVGYVTAGGVLTVLCYNGTSWTQEWTATVGGTGTTRRFDIAYETTSGDAMVLYSTNTATTNELAYRTKQGSTGCGSGNWAGATNLDPVHTTGIVQWVKMAWDRRAGQNCITAIWADANSDLSAMVWSTTAWSNEPSAALASALQVVTTAQDIEDFDVEYESLSGDVMVVWGIAVGNNTNGVRYATCTGGTSSCTWSAVTTPPTFNDDATNLDISANPDSDEMVFGSVGINQNDLQIGYWSGTTWTDDANDDTSCNPPVAGSKTISTGWVISGVLTRSIIRYADQGSSAIDWYRGNAGVFTKETDFAISPAPSGPVYYDVQMNPMSKDQLMSLVSDGANTVFAKRLVLSAGPTFTWTNSDGVALETTLPQGINSPFSFAFWRQSL